MALAQTDPTAAAYDPLRVIAVDINMDPDLWNRLRAQERTFVSLFSGECLDQPFDNPFTYFPAAVTIDGQHRTNVGVRKKGFLGSLDTIKPGLKIDLSEFQSNSAIHGLKKFTLNNAKQDPSLIRQCLGYQLFERAGLPAPRCNFANVTVNGKNLGIYANIEEVRKPLLSRHFSDASGNLYEGTVSDFHPALMKTFEMQSNEDVNDGSDLFAVMRALDVKESKLIASLGRVIDVDSFMKFWAMEGLVGHWDGYSSNRNNYYLYHDPLSGKFNFIPWGIDTILSVGSPIAARDPNANTALFAYSAITRRLVELPQIRQRYRAQMQALLNTLWSESTILAEINRMENLLRPYAGDLSAPMSSLRTFVSGRRGQVNAALNDHKLTFPDLSIISPCLERNGKVTGSFAATWGTNGTVPPFQTGFAASRGHVSQVSVRSTSGAADAGLSLLDPNPHVGSLTLYLKLANGRLAAMPIKVDSTLLSTGAVLPIDGKTVDGSFLFLDGVTAGGFLEAGRLKVYSALIAPGGRVCGTFEARTSFFTNRDLAKKHSKHEPARREADADEHHATNLHAHLGETMAQCLPSATSSAR